MYGAFMGCNGDIVVAGITFLPPTTVRVFSVHDVNGATVQAFSLFAARLAGSMECQALRAVKGQIALVADDGGFAVHVVVRTGCWLVSVAGPASGPLTGVVGSIIMVITTVALVAPIALVNEPCDGGAPLVMIIGLEKDDLVFGVWATEDQEEWMVAG